MTTSTILDADVMVDPEVLSSAARFVQSEWGDVGYSMGAVRHLAGRLGLFVVRHGADGSRFFVGADRQGNTWQIPEECDTPDAAWGYIHSKYTAS